MPFLNTAMELCKDIFRKCFSLHSADMVQDQKWHCTLPLRKKNTGQKSLPFLGSKTWSKIDPSIKNIRILSSFMHAVKKNILLPPQNLFK